VVVMMVVVVMVHRASPQAAMLALRGAPAKAQSSDTGSVSVRPHMRQSVVALVQVGV